MVTIEQIIQASYRPALKAAKDGRHWISPKLESLQKAGRIKIMTLGPQVEKSYIDKNGIISSKSYNSQQISIPLVWSKSDNANNSTENQKVSLVYQLLKNGWYNHDDVLEEKIGDRMAVVSRDYRYNRGNIMELSDSQAYCFRIFTAVAFVD